MRKTLEIITTSLSLAIKELRNNKLRTFLSLFGVTIGIFCIIGVLATLNSLEQNIQNDVKALGTNTIYIDKWDYSGGSDYPWWKYQKRPAPKYEEMELIRKKTSAASNIAMYMSTNRTLNYGDDALDNVNIFGVTEEFDKIQNFEIQYGRYFAQMEYDQGSPAAVIGWENAEKLFENPERALGKEVEFRNRKVVIIGVIKKKGASMVGGFQYDQCLITPYDYFRRVFEERYSNPVIMVQGKDKVTSDALKDELKGSMRAIRRLGPLEEDDFSLNAISDFSNAVSSLFASINLGGWLIGLLSLIVGAFGIANIMFVTVRERTPIIGLKKAIGAKRRIIMWEFLMESAFICIIGGLLGLMLVFVLTQILSSAFNFPIYISVGIIGLSLGICIFIGMVAGIIPASIAAKMDPVVAIRSK
jgi:putative ABC transport system permease protein